MASCCLSKLDSKRFTCSTVARKAEIWVFHTLDTLPRYLNKLCSTNKHKNMASLSGKVALVTGGSKASVELLV